MGIFNKTKNTKDNSNAFSRIAEEALYDKALGELESGKMKKGVYAKALADCSGDEEKVSSLYLKYRVQSLVDEEVYRMDKEMQKAQAKEEEKLRKEQSMRKPSRFENAMFEEWTFLDSTEKLIRVIVYPVVSVGLFSLLIYFELLPSQW